MRVVCSANVWCVYTCFCAHMSVCVYCVCMRVHECVHDITHYRVSLGVRHVKGMLLYGPPGTGKTLLARQIGKMLNAHELKIVNGPG